MTVKSGFEFFNISTMIDDEQDNPNSDYQTINYQHVFPLKYVAIT